MQEIGRLVLGIDLCDDITQVTLLRPHAAEPVALCFGAGTAKEYLPTALLIGEDGTLHLKAPAGNGEGVLTNFFHRAVLGEEISFRGGLYKGRMLLEQYVTLLFGRIRELFPEYEIEAVAVTCEEVNMNEAVRRLLCEVLEEQEAFCRHYLVLSHLEAFLHFAIRQEEGLWQNGSAALDYGADGLLLYHTECRSAGGRRLLLTEYQDYSGIFPTGFPKTEETERVALTFERLAGAALQKNADSLFVTGREFEGEWVSDVLRLLSAGRRVFRGENLYTQGACYAAEEDRKGEMREDVLLLMPGQLTSDVYLLAENAAQEETVLLAGVGEPYEQIHAEVEVLLDATDRISFQIIPAGREKAFLLRVAPEGLEVRPDRTSRYLLRVSFVRRDCMVIQIKEIGFGEFYPPSHRIYEELVELSQLES